MELRNWFGIILIVIGSSVQVAGFYDQTWLRIIGFVLIFIGFFIFITQRYISFKESQEYNYSPSQKNTSLPLIGDIFNISGQRTGGRKDDNFSSDSSGSNGDGGGGD